MSTMQAEPPPEVQETPPEVEDTNVTETLVREHDRCDRCGAEAHVKTRHPLGRHATDEVAEHDLLWCKHHYEAFPSLAQFVVLDLRDRLLVTLTSSY